MFLPCLVFAALLSKLCCAASNHSWQFNNPKLDKTNITIALVNQFCVLKGVAYNSSMVVSLPKDPAVHNLGTNFGSAANIIAQDLVMKIAIDMINNDTTILPNIHVNFERYTDCGKWYYGIWNSYTGNSSGFAAGVTAKEVVDSKAIGAVSYEYSTALKGAGEVLSTSKIPICSANALSPAFSDKNRYPYLFRTLSGKGLERRFFQLLQYWNVSRVAIIFANTDEEAFQNAENTQTFLRKKGISILSFFGLNAGANDAVDTDEVKNLCAELKRSETRYSIMLGQTRFLGNVYWELGKCELIDSKRVYMSNTIPGIIYKPNQILANQYIQGFIYLRQPRQRTALNGPLIDSVNKRMYYLTKDTQFALGSGKNLSNLDFVNQFSLYSSFDCVMLLLRGIDTFLKTNPQFQEEQLALREYNNLLNYTQFTNLSYNGLTASPILLNANADLILPYEAAFLTGNYQNLTVFGIINDKGLEFTPNPNITVMFNGGMTNPPPDGPTPVALELIEYTSEEFYGRSMIVMSSVGLTLTVAFLIIVILYHKNPIIKSASIFNTLIFLIGCAISYATILAQLSPKYVMQCQLRLVGLELGFILTISPLIFKNALLSHLFHMTSRIKGVDYMTVRYRIANAAVILIEVILLSLRISHANFVIAEKSTESYTQRVCEDQNDPVAYISKDVLLYYNLCILLCFLPVLYYLQNVRWSRYNETAQIAIIFVIILIAIGMVQLLGFSVDKYSDFHISVVSFVCLTLILFASVGSRVLEVILEQRQFADLLYRLSLMHTQVAIQGEKMMRSKSYSADGISKPSKSMRSDKSLVAVFETSLKPKAIKSSEIGGGVGAGSVAGSSSKALLPAGGQFLFLSRPETIKAAKMDTIDEGVFYRVKDAKSRYWWSCWKVGEPLMVKLQTKKKWICFSSHYISECFVITDTTKWVLEACTLRLSLKDETVSTARDLYVVEIEFENVALANRFMAEVKTF